MPYAAYAFKNLVDSVLGPLEPFVLLEEPVEEQTGDQHQQQGRRVAELPLELGHDLKVHAVHRADDSGHHE